LCLHPGDSFAAQRALSLHHLTAVAGWLQRSNCSVESP
jgi:hypothetical protein